LSEDSIPVISIRGLRKSYGDVEAVRGIDLEVRRGEVFAFLGPNGAGKTTTVEILEGYRKRSGGEVSVLGEDPQRAGRGWREQIGIVLQSGRLEPYLTVAESLSLYAGYYRAPRPVEEVIEAVGLAGKADERTGRLSGGQQRRLDVGMALIGDPELLFLDEPTTGFDPQARRDFWELIQSLAGGGTTILLTTHYLDEAEHLADRVGVIAAGRMLALDTPANLGGRASSRATVTWEDEAGTRHTERTSTPTQLVAQLAARHGGEVPKLTVTRPSLEDTYLSLIAPHLDTPTEDVTLEEVTA
jgi:ABC-2 type transport system ATP-binding protein